MGDALLIMRLVDVEIQHYRSIQNQTADESIQLRGLDCLVGKNNAGKTNILSAIKFLLEKEEKSLNREMYWQLNTQLNVEVRGFFEVDEHDFSLITDDEKRGDCKTSLIDRGEHEGCLGICRIEKSDGQGQPKLHRLAYLPDEDRLSLDALADYRDTRWEDQKDPNKTFSKSDYAQAMKEQYPEIADLIPSGKHRQKGIWRDKLIEYIRSDPSDVEFSLQPTEFISGTKQTIRDKLLPEVISVPAVREVSSTMKRGGEFGNLIQQIQSEIQEELDKQVQEELGSIEPRQYESVARIEKQISQYLSKTFEDQSVKIGFPEFSTEHLFKSADIKIQEEHLDELSKENVGEGVKRTVIFSLLRTLADLRAGHISLGETEAEPDSPPFLILYEEAELFLHPSLQRQLLRVLEDLSTDDSQVIFSTHSPVMIQQDALDTINIVRKDSDTGSYVTQFHQALKDFTDDKAETERLTQMERVSSYIFADKVVLVEGVSDRIFLRKVAPYMNPKWDFDGESVPVLDVGGKRDVRIFYQFLNELDIDAHCVLDLDAIEDEIPKLAEDEELQNDIEEFNELVATEAVEPAYSEERLSNAVSFMPWNHDDHSDAFEHLEDLMHRIQANEELVDRDAEIIEKVLAKSEQTEPSKSDYSREEFAEKRVNIVEQLLEQNVLLLNGEIEDYFPTKHGRRKKHHNALLYDPENDSDSDHPTDRFGRLESYDETDFEVFLRRVFAT